MSVCLSVPATRSHRACDHFNVPMCVCACAIVSLSLCACVVRACVCIIYKCTDTNTSPSQITSGPWCFLHKIMHLFTYLCNVMRAGSVQAVRGHNACDRLWVPTHAHAHARARTHSRTPPRQRHTRGSGLQLGPPCEQLLHQYFEFRSFPRTTGRPEW